MPATILATISRTIDCFTEYLGRTISWLTLVMVVITVLIVILRYGFEIGSIALQESVMYMHALVFLLGASYTLKHDEHVRVDIIYCKLSAKQKAWVNILGSLIFLQPVCLFIIWASWHYVVESWIHLETSRETGGIPAIFLLKSFILLMALTMSLQGLAESLKNILLIRQSTPLADKTAANN